MKTLTKPHLTPVQPSALPAEIIYPESDGLPMADNTKQFRIITTIQGNLDSLYADHPQVLVVGDLFWYPVKDNNKLRRAPDVMVVFGVPKGDRRSYLQWQENNIAPQVVFEIRSPSNTNKEMREKRVFYETYGVLEYYVYDPDRVTLEGWQRRGVKLETISQMRGWVSPQLKIRFDLVEGDLKLYDPEGRPFLSFVELNDQREADILARFAAEMQVDEVEAKLKVEAEARAAAEARLREAEAKLRDLGLL